MLVLLIFAEYTDDCSHNLFHCEIKTYLITTGTFLGGILLCVCVAKLNQMYIRRYRTVLMRQYSDEDFSYKIPEN